MPRLRIALYVIVAAPAVWLAAQGAVAQDAFLSPNLANNLRTHLESVGLSEGRITAVARFTGGRGFSHTSQSGERRESLRISLNGLAPSIDFELSTSELKIELDMDDGRALRIRRTPQGEGKSKFLEFKQPEEGPIVLVVDGDETDKTYEAESLWHLLLAEPQLAAELEPLLRLLRPGWPLVSDLQSLEQSLYKQVESTRKYDREAWAALVAQLRSPRYVERVEADRLLRELGKDAVPFLRSFMPSQLDAEQAYRIRMIVDRYGSEARLDTPESAAERLLSDPDVWYALAGRATEQQADKVRLQLSNLLGEPIEFDAAAEPEVREVQLAKIRALIDRVKQSATK